jgi:hypothetical protein
VSGRRPATNSLAVTDLPDRRGPGGAAAVLPHLMMFSAVLAWVINASVMKVGLRYLDPASFTAARFVIAAVASWSLSIAIHRRRGFQPPPASRPTGHPASSAGAGAHPQGSGHQVTNVPDLPDAPHRKERGDGGLVVAGMSHVIVPRAARHRRRG